MTHVIEIWADTGETIQRDPTQDELAQWAADRAAQEAAQAAADALAVERAAARAALLGRLGISEEEALLLLGGVS